MEYAAAKSTMCRQCGTTFRRRGSEAKSRLRLKGGSASSRRPLPPIHRFFRKLEGFWAKHHSSSIECFDCKAKQEVSSAATLDHLPVVQRAY